MEKPRDRHLGHNDAFQTEYSALLYLLIELIESQNGKKLELETKWLNDAQILSIKLFQHLTSMQILAGGYMIKVNGKQKIYHIDHPSIKVVARAALETYLVFHFIYDSEDKSLSIFRHKLWRIAGLVDRQKYDFNFEGQQKKLANERNTLNKLREEVKSSDHFTNFSGNQQFQLLKGRWRTGNSWTDLGCSAGFHVKYFTDVYNYLCGYSHSSYASVLQIGQARLVDEQQMLTHGILCVGIKLMSHFISSYSGVFPEAEYVISSNPEARNIAEQYRFGADKMSEFYKE